MAHMPGAEVMDSRGEGGGRQALGSLEQGVMSELPIRCSTLAGVTGRCRVRGQHGGKAVLARAGRRREVHWDTLGR